MLTVISQIVVDISHLGLVYNVDVILGTVPNFIQVRRDQKITVFSWPVGSSLFSQAGLTALILVVFAQWLVC